MSEARIQQMLDAQIERLDPFVQSQNVFQAQQAVPSLDNLIQGGPGVESFKTEASVKAPEESQLKNLFSSKPADRENFEAGKLPKALQKIGIDDKNLALNDIGRIQLIGRLKEKFGPSYNENPEALEALSLFDEQISKFKDEKRSSLNRSVSSGERSLAAILGGKA